MGLIVIVKYLLIWYNIKNKQNNTIKEEIRLKIAICDDYAKDIDLLHSSIATHPMSDKFDIEVYTSSKDLLLKISKGKSFDVIFLDVDMPELSGIELGKKIRQFLPKSFIVFVTNYPQYALDAYDCEAYHYLIKPIITEKLHAILDKLAKNFKDRNQEYVIQGRFENVRVHVSDILYVEYYRKHVRFYLDTSGEKIYEVIGSLTEVYDKLKMFGFFRCHQAFIVNLGKIIKFDGYNAVLVNKAIVPISVRNKSDLITAYSDYHKDVV